MQHLKDSSTHVSLPHPNANSHFYDRIMSGGFYDPNSGKIHLRTELKKYSYS